MKNNEFITMQKNDYDFINMKNNNYDFIRDGILGLIIGDIVGVPAEFSSRESLKQKPVKEMLEFGTHYQPRGTWSDDTSMTLCTMDSLINGYDLDDMMDKFCAWIYDGEYTPWGKVFDHGGITAAALANYKSKLPILDCGIRSFHSNGNGSLMRILPMVYYQFVKCLDFVYNCRPALINPIHEVSALTHAHPISMIGCGIYAQLIAALIRNKNAEKERLADVFENAMDQIKMDYEYNGYGNIFADADYKDALTEYNRVFNIQELANLEEKDIKSSGYVVHTLEAALWCFLTTDSYRECILKAVNLGSDTDTVAAVAGSFAGIYYGVDQMPKDWVESVVRLDWIEDMIRRFSESIISKK